MGMQIIKFFNCWLLCNVFLFANERIVCQPLEKVVFTCKIKSEILQFCQGEDHQIRWLRGKFVSTTNPLEITAGTLVGIKQAVVSQKQEYRKLTTTVFIEQGDFTYGLSTCLGMFCGEYAGRPWLNIYTKGQKVASLVCDEGTWDEGDGGFPKDRAWNPKEDSLYKVETLQLDIGCSE